ncbi:MAG TPA: hypothetical protein VD995_09705 [Azospirillum sp.]|nr:hypothetical protein [Azospirillum sp.]
MRLLIVSVASVAALLAGCSNGLMSEGTSGSSSVDRETISPNRPGMGQGATRQSLPETGSVPGAPTPDANVQQYGQVREPDPTISPNRPGMGWGATRGSLHDPSRAGSGASDSSAFPRENETISPNRPGMGPGVTRRSLPDSGVSQ